ncbi:MAG: exo-beta-N-acetylmuramidase NamZ domain-containing protein [Sandaracinaceae bacterium]
MPGTVGLLAHAASVDPALRHAVELLPAAGVRLARLFGPEHGLGGAAQDMVGVDDRTTAGGLPVVSLYGADEASLTPRAEDLAGLDAVLIDLQDVGSRYYTYVWTAARMLVAASAAGVRTVVLDRPNPLGGRSVEGAPQRAGYRSFVGLYDVAVRHGMTVGEILTMVRDGEGLAPESLEVVRMEGWRRDLTFEATGLPWVLPSPNMPTLDTAFVYPGGCLLEGTALSEGRGHTRPFEVWGAPGLDGAALRDRVAIEGAALRALTFTPTFHKHGGERCGGVQVHVTDRARFRPYAAYVRLLGEARLLLGPRFRWRTQPYEFVSDVPAIDLLSGGPELRAAVDDGADVREVLLAEAAGEAEFRDRRRAWLLYPDRG